MVLLIGFIMVYLKLNQIHKLNGLIIWFLMLVMLI